MCLTTISGKGKALLTFDYVILLSTASFLNDISIAKEFITCSVVS